jgi:hypothetical protein
MMQRESKSAARGRRPSSLDMEGNPMRTLSIALLTTALAFGANAASSQESKDAPKPDAQTMCCTDSKAQMAKMDEHMKRMQALHEKMASATTPEARQTLMIDQRREMQQAMAVMHEMPHGGTMMGGTGMAGQKTKPVDPKTQMQMMEKRMDMMQMMMQTMLDQQAASGSAMMQAPAK